MTRDAGAPKLAAAAASSVRSASGSGSRARAARLAAGAGYGRGLIPVDRSIHGSGAAGKAAAAAARRPPCRLKASSVLDLKFAGISVMRPSELQIREAHSKAGWLVS